MLRVILYDLDGTLVETAPEIADAVNDTLAEGETNDQGEAEFDLNLSRFAAATYRLRFLANVDPIDVTRALDGLDPARASRRANRIMAST